MKKVSIVIPVYGQWNLVKRNIDALLKFDTENIEEIIIVDDSSRERNPYHFETPLVKIICNQTNLGYTRTVNKGLKQAISEIIVLLDSDAYPLAPFIQKLLAIYNDPIIGCVGFSTVDEEQNDTGNYQFESTIAGLIMGQALEFKLRNFSIKRNRNILPNSCAVSFRKTCLEEMDYFDADTFPVLEADVDLSMRIHRSNWKLLFTREIVICHKGGNSYRVNYKRVLLYHKSKWKLLKKFNLILYPELSKALMKVRVRTELSMLSILSSFRANTTELDEKKYGRRLLLKEIDTYR